MQVKDMMTTNTVCCTPATPLPEAARLMVTHDCGAIPVVETEQHRKPIGMITDRDICCRAVAMNKNPLAMTVGDCMSEGCVSVTPETSVEECGDRMQEAQVRRVVVVDEEGRCCGIVAQADLADAAPQQVAETLSGVSRPIPSASAVGSSAGG